MCICVYYRNGGKYNLFMPIPVYPAKGTNIISKIIPSNMTVDACPVGWRKMGSLNVSNGSGNTWRSNDHNILFGTYFYIVYKDLCSIPPKIQK